MSSDTTSQFSEYLVFGPVPPFRGGVARHTELLATELSRFSSVTVISDVRLYSNWLYPGASQFLPNETGILARGSSQLRVKVQSLLRSLLTCLSIPNRKKTRVILIWWTPALFHKFVLRRFILWIKRADTVIFCHNVELHEPSVIQQVLSRVALFRVRKVVVQSEDELAKIMRMSPRSNAFVFPHPPFPAAPTPGMSDSVNKRKIEYDKSRTRLLFFGFIRPYKGITTLLDALKISDQIAKFELHIVGECWDDVLRLAIDEMVNDPDSNISANLNFVSDEVAAELFSWTDFVMLPYLSATGSGVLSQAISYRKPVIASAVDPFGSTIRESLDGYLHETGSAAKLAACLDALVKGDLQIPTDPWTTNPKITSWEELARGIAAL